MTTVAKLRRGRALGLKAMTLLAFLPPLLTRLVIGHAFWETGKGKIENFANTVSFFTDLGIPFPTANAYLVGCVECFGGLLLIAGLGSRWVALALAMNMTVAYLTAHRWSLAPLFQNGETWDFAGQAPFWFLTTSLIVLALGPGCISLDAIGKFVYTRHAHTPKLATTPAVD